MKLLRIIGLVFVAIIALAIITAPDVDPETQTASPDWNQSETVEEKHDRWDRGDFTEDEIREMNQDQAEDNVNAWK